MLFCERCNEYGIDVCLVSFSKPVLGSLPKRLPIIGIKTSVGKVVEKSPFYYMTNQWKKEYDEWLKNAVHNFPSVLEHAYFGIFINGCSRVCSHQLVRHRIASFTQESQRYTEQRILKFFNVKNINEIDENLFVETIKRKGLHVLFSYPTTISTERLKGIERSLWEYIQCRKEETKMEDCRYLLPQAVRTSLMVTANLREWLHIFKLRCSPKAQEEIRCVICLLPKLLKPFDLDFLFNEVMKEEQKSN